MFVNTPQHSYPLGNPHLVRSIPTFAQKTPHPYIFGLPHHTPPHLLDCTPQMGGGKVPKHVCEEPPAFITPWQPSPGEEHSDFCSKKPPTHTFLAYPTIHHPTCWTVPPRWGVEKFS